MTLGNFKIRVRRRGKDVQVSRLKRLASGSYVLAAHATFPNRDLGKQPFTMAELVDAKILPSPSVEPE